MTYALCSGCIKDDHALCSRERQKVAAHLVLIWCDCNPCFLAREAAHRQRKQARDRASAAPPTPRKEDSRKPTRAMVDAWRTRRDAGESVLVIARSVGFSDHTVRAYLKGDKTPREEG